jgi:hypothetical protein
LLCSTGTQLFEDEEEAFWQCRKEKKIFWQLASDTGEEGSADNDAAADESATMMQLQMDIKREKEGEKKRAGQIFGQGWSEQETRNQQKGTPPTGDWTRARIRMMEMNEKKEEKKLEERRNRICSEPKAKSKRISQKPKPKAK